MCIYELEKRVMLTFLNYVLLNFLNHINGMFLNFENKNFFRKVDKQPNSFWAPRTTKHVLLVKSHTLTMKVIVLRIQKFKTNLV